MSRTNSTPLDQYEQYKSQNLSLDMSRGKPSVEQLDLSMGMLSLLTESQDCVDKTDFDARNYGLLCGIVEMKELFADLFDISAQNIIIGPAASLNLMYDTLARCMLFGTHEGATPWSKQGTVKFLCPSPGYDRHFAMCEVFGIEMIPVDMTPDGPDMAQIEALVAADSTIKGMWIVPTYSNSTGITCTPETIRRMAVLKPAADDFRIFCDDAYAVHHLYDTPDATASLLNQAERAGNADMVYLFSSFAKITHPGSTVSMFAASERNVAFAKSHMSRQTICNDKMNQLRHVRFFGTAENVRAHMKLHADILRPKFECVLDIFAEELSEIATWTRPRGGYFISLDLPDGTAKRTYELCREAGVTLTTPGATYPYGIDPRDRNLRIAPSFPSVEELKIAARVLCVCAKIAATEVQ